MCCELNSVLEKQALNVSGRGHFSQSAAAIGPLYTRLGTRHPTNESASPTSNRTRYSQLFHLMLRRVPIPGVDHDLHVLALLVSHLELPAVGSHQFDFQLA